MTCLNWMESTAAGRRKVLLAAAGAGAMMWGQAALAQTASAPQNDPAEVEAVVVTGFRSSLEKALEVKRANTAAVDSIVAEDIAKFPDNNLAEAIQRVPGVAITRDGGEGRNLSVRGLSEEFTRVRINGVEAQATTGSNRGRGFDFNVFASELFSQIDVRKTPSADVEEGSLGATVDLRTGHPFDYRGFKMAGSAKMGWNDLSKSYDPRMALLVSNTFKDDTFGALFSVAYSERGTRQNGASTGLWNQGNADGGWCSVAARPALCAGADATDTATASLATTRYPRFLRYQQYELETKRLGLTGSLQWRPTDRTEITFDMLYSKFEGSRNERQLEAIGFSRAASQGGKPEIVVRDLVLDDKGTMVYGLFDNVDLRSENYLDKYDTEFTQWTLNAKHKLTDKWSVKGLLGYVANDFDNALDYIAQMDRLNSDNYSFDFRPNGQYFPAINYGFDVTDPNAWYIGPTQTVAGGTGPTGPDIRLRPNWNDNKYKVAQFDTEYELNDHLTLKGGANWKKYAFIGQGQRLAAGEGNIPVMPAGSTMTSLTEQWCGLQGLNLPAGTPVCWASPNRDAIAKAYDIFSNSGRFALSSTTSSARGDNRRVNEEDKGAYVMAAFKFDALGMPVRGDVGVRYVKTEQSSTFFATVPTTVDPAGFQLTTVGRSYEDTLPSLNLVVEPREDVIVRIGAAKVMSRPGLGSLSAATNVSVAGGSRTVTTGNPMLEPYRAKTFDVAVEWYPKRGAILSAAFFYKDISTYIQNITTLAPYSTTGLPASLLQGTGVTVDDQFTISNVINTPGGPLKGVELNYQQPLTFLPWKLKNFGVLLNYTFVDSKIDYFLTTTAGAATVSRDLLNLSKNAYNGTLYYEEGPVQARISLAHRDKYLTAVPSSYNVDVSGRKPTTFVDFSASYRINDALTFSVEGLNLTNEKDITYSDSTAERLSDYFQSGRQYFVGVRYSF
ncbi:TonB-dependent receptor [Caulobacter sp.]|uniref:TonB-dependent receptor n=1 Tax=Caulobacter sp. TaxID=78 RepID=UPI001B262037|nr:TonB-dependent receptor [Caulobacter sp.]MBO9547051.1 TonB-dependent receptor [Caulobacter sp.]